MRNGLEKREEQGTSGLVWRRVSEGECWMLEGRGEERRGFDPQRQGSGMLGCDGGRARGGGLPAAESVAAVGGSEPRSIVLAPEPPLRLLLRSLLRLLVHPHLAL